MFVHRMKKIITSKNHAKVKFQINYHEKSIESDKTVDATEFLGSELCKISPKNELPQKASLRN